MGWKGVLSIIFVLLSILLLVIYWFVPIGEINFNSGVSHSNFSLGNSTSMQFYNNMRFPSSEISYKIYDCGLQKQNDMQEAFNIISNKTCLVFREIVNGEEISITCSEKIKMDEGLFVAGEGGPTKIIQTGFDHSENNKNIMYYMSECGQTIGEDMLDLIDELYEAESYPDLSFGNVSASVSGTYLDFEVNVKNNGLAVSENAKIKVYADDKLVEEVELKSLEIGTGLKITLENLWMPKRNPKELKFVIEYNFEELDKLNNVLVLNV